MPIIIYLPSSPSPGTPLPAPNWRVIDAVEAELGFPPYPWPLPPRDGAR